MRTSLARLSLYLSLLFFLSLTLIAVTWSSGRPVVFAQADQPLVVSPAPQELPVLTDLSTPLSEQALLPNNVFLPFIASPPLEPTPTPTPSLTPSPSPTSPPLPTPTPSPTPGPLPAGLTYVEHGTVFNNTTECRIADPHPVPVTYPAGTQTIAYSVGIDTSVYSIGVEIEGMFGGAIRGTDCDRYAVINGQQRLIQIGTSIQRADGATLPSGPYTFRIYLNGRPQPALVMQLVIQ